MTSLNVLPTRPLAEEFMKVISQDIESFVPLVAQRCVMSGWRSIDSL